MERVNLMFRKDLEETQIWQLGEKRWIYLSGLSCVTNTYNLSNFGDRIYVSPPLPQVICIEKEKKRLLKQPRLVIS